MQADTTSAHYRWLCTGSEVFPAMLAEIEAARESVNLETYIFSPGPLAVRFRDVLVGARRRGASVRVLVDGLGSYGLAAGFWETLLEAGGQFRVFNPATLNRLSIRNHRKLLVCDDRVAFVGGFNIAEEYNGDGVSSGWCDLGLRLEGPLALELRISFDEMFARADFRHRRFARLRKSASTRTVQSSSTQLLLSGPGRGVSPIKRALKLDLLRANSVQIVSAYFLPTWRLRRRLMQLARRGARVQLLLAGKTDVKLSQLAARSLYRRFLRAGVEIYEYQPQVLHAKLIVMNQSVYIGSANLDQRSLNFNYELLIRFSDPEMILRAREAFERTLRHAHRITPEAWRKSGSIWSRLKQHFAYWMLVRLDPYIARRQWRALPD